MIDPLTRLVLVLMVALASSVGLAGAGVTTVSLRPTVRLAPGETVTLGSIARIDGDEAGTLEGLAVGSEAVAPGRWTTVEAEAVRGVIEASGARTGSVVVVGARSSVTRRGETPGAATAHPAGGEPAEGTVVVRDHIESWVQSRFSVRPQDVRVAIDERDRAMATMPTQGRVVEIQPVGTSSRMVLRVRVYERDRIEAEQTVRLTIEVRTMAPVAAVPLRRGEKVGDGSFEVREIWTDPIDPPADPATVVGQVARRGVNPGEVIRTGDLEPPVLVHRGQDVSVRMVRGSVVVTSTARARHDAMEGEMVELEAKDRSGRRFTARVAGPGRVVMIDPTEVTP
tara:strand:- start:2242 stop:3261 length:1020 start_codon:yes stop_codon:yes gene_type:complete